MWWIFTVVYNVLVQLNDCETVEAPDLNYEVSCERCEPDFHNSCESEWKRIPLQQDKLIRGFSNNQDIKAPSQLFQL